MPARPQIPEHPCLLLHLGHGTVTSPVLLRARAALGPPRTPTPQPITDHCHLITVIKLLFPLSQSSWVLFCSVIKLFHLLGLLLNSSQDKAAGHASRDTGTDAHTGFIFTNKALCWSCCFSARGLATPGHRAHLGHRAPSPGAEREGKDDFAAALLE